VIRSRLLSLHRDFDEATQLLSDHVDDRHIPGWVRRELVIEQARSLFNRNRAVEGLELLRAADDPATSALLRAISPELRAGASHVQPVPGYELPFRLRIEADVVRAGVLLRTGGATEAATILEKVMPLARSERLRRPFLDTSRQVRSLLRTDPRLIAISGWLNPQGSSAAAGDGLSQPAASPPPRPFQALSQREREILTGFANMKSTEEVAATLFISVNTVRTHVRSILRKLSCDRRGMAVRRPRELQMI